MKTFGIKNIFMMLCCFLALLLAGCSASPKDVAVDRLRKLFTDAKENSKHYTDDQWLNYLDEYQQVDSLLSLYVFTEEEMAEISPMKGLCAAYAMKARSVKDSHKLDNALNESRGVFKGYDSGL